MAFGTAVRQHVQGCFDHEAELLPLIENAETEAELNLINVVVRLPQLDVAFSPFCRKLAKGAF